MAIAITPNITITLEGDNISSFTKIKSWTLSQKNEMIQLIKSDDGDITIDLSNIEDIELLVFYSESSFNIEITTTVGEENPVTTVMTIPVLGFFILNTIQTFIDTITSLKINTDSTTDITVYVNTYGKVS